MKTFSLGANKINKQGLGKKLITVTVVVGFLGFFVGTYTAGKLDTLVDCFLEIAKIYGPFVAFSVIIVFVFILIICWLIKETIRPRDKEIGRLVEERDKLQEIILKRRLSSQNKGGRK